MTCTWCNARLQRQGHFRGGPIDRMMPRRLSLALYQESRSSQRRLATKRAPETTPSCRDGQSQGLQLILTGAGLAELQLLLSSGPQEVELRVPDHEVCFRTVLALEREVSLDVFAHGTATVDWVGATISSRSGCTRLSRTELRLFGALFDARGSIIERRRLIEGTWPNATVVEGANALGVYVHLLRQRLSAIGVAAALKTVRGVGYQLAR